MGEAEIEVNWVLIFSEDSFKFLWHSCHRGNINVGLPPALLCCSLLTWWRDDNSRVIISPGLCSSGWWVVGYGQMAGKFSIEACFLLNKDRTKKVSYFNCKHDLPCWADAFIESLTWVLILFCWNLPAQNMAWRCFSESLAFLLHVAD